MERVPGLMGVLQPFNSPSRSSGLVVDVLAGQGHVWVKVIARKAQALHLIWAGQGQFGERDLLNQANEYLSCAKANLHHFTPPMVYFAFYNHVTRPMAEALSCLGIHVLGTVVDVEENVQDKLASLCFDDDDDDDDDYDVKVPVLDNCLPNVERRRFDGNEIPGSQAIENREVSASELSTRADESCKGHSVNRSIARDTSVCSDQGVLSGRLSAEHTHLINERTLLLETEKRFAKATVEKYHRSLSPAIYYDDNNSSCRRIQTSEHSSKTNLMNQQMRFSMESSHENPFNVCEQRIIPSDAFVYPSDLDSSQCTSSSRVDGHFDAIDQQCMLNQFHEMKMAEEKSFEKEGSESLPKEAMANMCVPTQRPSHERLHSFTENVSISSAHIKPCASGPSPSSPFDALFKHIVSSPPVFRSNGSVLLECISSGFGPCHVSDVDPVSRDQTISIAPLYAPLPVTKANLDISTLITLVSSVSHGNCHFRFANKVLSLQAEEERKSPVLPALKQFLEGKRLLACHTAVSSFDAILQTLGGPREKERASELMTRVHVVPDEPSTRTMALECQGKIKERSKIVFGTGDHLRAVTVTSNMGFVRAAKNQGVVFSVFFHQARALTEQKEGDAKPLPDTS